MSGPPRTPKPPSPPGSAQQRPPTFDPSRPLLDLRDSTVDPLLPPLGLPSRRATDAPSGLGPVSMRDSVQDGTTQVSPADTRHSAPLAGGTQVAAVQIPTAAPTPASLVPGRNRSRSSAPFVVLSIAAALAWAGAAAAAFVSDGPASPSIGVSPPTAPAPKPATVPVAAKEPSPSAPAAPAPEEPDAQTWVASTPGPTRSIALAGNTVVASFDTSVIGYRNGEPVWTIETPHVAALAFNDAMIIVVTERDVIGVAPSDGAERFRHVLDDSGKGNAITASADPTHVLVATSNARFIVVTPDACTTQPSDEECMRVAGRLSGEYLEPDALVALGEDGTRVLAEDDTLRVFDIDIRTAFEVSTPARIERVRAVPGGRIAIQFGPEAALLDPARCRGRSEIRLTTSDTRGPAGCVLWRYGRALDPNTISAVDTSSVALNERGKLQAVAEGDDLWKVSLGSFGPVVNGSQTVFSLALEGGAMQVVEVDAGHGTVTQTYPLPIADAPEQRGSAALAWREGTLAVAMGAQLAVLRLDQAQ